MLRFSLECIFFMQTWNQFWDAIVVRIENSKPIIRCTKKKRKRSSAWNIYVAGSDRACRPLCPLPQAQTSHRLKHLYCLALNLCPLGSINTIRHITFLTVVCWGVLGIPSTCSGKSTGFQGSIHKKPTLLHHLDGAHRCINYRLPLHTHMTTLSISLAWLLNE